MTMVTKAAEDALSHQDNIRGTAREQAEVNCKLFFIVEPWSAVVFVWLE
jgi:hypothetical protein